MNLKQSVRNVAAFLGRNRVLLALLALTLVAA
jgi:hypothetical protein